MYLKDKRIWWENMKYEIRFSIKFSKTMKKVETAKEREIREALRKELVIGKYINILKVTELEEKLKKKKKKEKCQGARFRSKSKYTVEGEKFTKFFFDLERRKGRAEMIQELKNADDECIKGTEF